MAEANKGSFNTGSYDGSYSTWPHYCTFSWELTKQDVENNKSTIKWYATMAGGATSTNYNTIHKWLITINGEEYSSSTSVTFYNGDQVCSGETEVTHKDDGSQKLSISAKFAFYQNYGYNSTGSGSWDLPKLIKAAVISSAKDTYIGSSCDIRWNHVPGCSYKLRFKLGNFVYTTGSFTQVSLDGTEIDEYVYTVSNLDKDDSRFKASCEKLYDELSDSTYGIMTVILGTYRSSTGKFLGSNTATFKLKVPEDETPIIDTANFVPIRMEPIDSNILIQNYNKLKFYVDFASLSPGKGSLLDYCTITGPGFESPKRVYTKDNGFETVTVDCGPISQTGEGLTYTLAVYDSRGRSASVIIGPITCYPHENPKLNLFNVFRCDGEGKANQSEKYIKCLCNFDYSSVNNTNTIDLKIYYKTTALSDKYNTGYYLVEDGLVKDGHNTSLSVPSEPLEVIVRDTGSECIEFDSGISYKFYIEIRDTYSGYYKSEEILILGEFRAINIMRDGTGIALGKMAVNEKMLDSKWPIMAEGFRIPQIQTGAVQITPSAANTPAYAPITFEPEFSGTPNVVVTPHTKVPGTTVLGVGVYDITSTGANISLTRTDTDATAVSWIAMYSPGSTDE